jgi:MtN3 and saliva related transmembrane protein
MYNNSNMSSHGYYLHLTKKSEKRIINRVCAVFAVIMPLTTLPQIFMLYGTKNASGLSLSMWVLYAIGCVPFLLFGIIYRHKQLILLNVLWLLVQAVMIVGILLYR